MKEEDDLVPVDNMCGRPAPDGWWPKTGCIRPTEHPLCPERCLIHSNERTVTNKKTKKVYRYRVYSTAKCEKHVTLDGRVWPFGKANREFA